MSSKAPIRIAIVGGGVAGSSAARILSQQPQFAVDLFEQGDSLVSGPPICHLHAGGNLYRELPEAECLQLLDESIDTLKQYPHCANIRPTVIAVPSRDPGTVADLLPRLARLRSHYQARVNKHPEDAVLGDPAHYFTLVSRERAGQLARQPYSDDLDAASRWLWPLCQYLDMDKVKWPLVLVQEFGLSLFRLAASAELSLAQTPNCQVHLGSAIEAVEHLAPGWRLTRSDGQVFDADVLVNACGFRSGVLDDLAGKPSQRMVEYKAAYLAKWPVQAPWPEVIFHGPRQSPEGMAQLTPYANNLFQLHGMTADITLFNDGLSACDQHGSHPPLTAEIRQRLEQGMGPAETEQRTRRAIDHLAYFLPRFATAQTGGRPLAGAQQIPGADPERRAAGLSLVQGDYARLGIVKASSAVPAAQVLLHHLCQEHGLSLPTSSTQPLSTDDIERRGRQLAQQRQYPTALANIYGYTAPRRSPCPDGVEY